MSVGEKSMTNEILKSEHPKKNGIEASVWNQRFRWKSKISFGTKDSVAKIIPEGTDLL